MPQSLSSIIVHLVFSTKNREPWIRATIESELFAYATTLLKNAGSPALAMNGTADHVHALVNLGRTNSIAQVVEELKGSTSRWIKTKGPEFHGFHWQAGYGAFSVSRSNVAESSTTFGARRSTIADDLSKMSSARYWRGTKCHSTSDTSGIERRLQSAPLGL